MATQKDAEILIALLRWSNEMGADAAFREVLADGFDRAAARVEDPAVGKVLTYGEAVGTLVKHGLLDRELVTDFWLASTVWERLGPAARRCREQMGEPRMFENFEALATNGPA